MIGKDPQQDEPKEPLDVDFQDYLWYKEQAEDREQVIRDEHPSVTLREGRGE